MEVFKAIFFTGIFLIAGQFLVGMERIWTRCQYLFAVRFLISDSVDKILNQKSFSKLWVSWPFMERVLHSGSLAPHKRKIVQFSQMSAILYCELTASVKDQSSPAAKIGPKIGVISNRWQHIEGNQWQIWQMFYTTYSPCVINHISTNNVYYCNTRV